MTDWRTYEATASQLLKERKALLEAAPQSPHFVELSKGMPQHALDGPSSWDRVLTCPGSLALCKGVESADSTFSYEGTCAHAVAEEAWNAGVSTDHYIGSVVVPPPEGMEPVVVTQLMADHAADYIRYCSNPDYDVRWAESVVDLSFWAADCFGSCDTITADLDRMHLNVFDLKYGQGVPVFAETTAQPVGYALGTVYALAKKYGIEWEKVTCHVYQPRLNSSTSVTYTMDELLTMGIYIRKRLKMARARNAELKVSQKGCKFCPRRGDCATRAEYYLRRAQAASLRIPDPKNVHLLKPEDVRFCLDNVKGIREWIGHFENSAMQSALDGFEIPTYKVVKGRKTRHWADDSEAEKIMRQMAGNKVEELYSEPKLKSPAQAEELFGKEVYKEHIAPHVVQANQRPSLVKDSDPRPGVDTVSRFEEFVQKPSRDAKYQEFVKNEPDPPASV